ncbi:MAG: 3'(2'),5'-bisphosphate nucleotidase CysQ [Chitinophagales bacterium]|nr:3'(2'),5'-bisphosphate nucleotidase CysQ [Chitinophagales bacterium]
MPDTINIQTIVDIARQAGETIMEVYRRDFNYEIKEDNSPLTEADRNSNHVIVEGLQAAYPQIPILSEESKAIPYDERKNWESFWLVDPLDGTKEFIKKNDEFTVNIALIRNGSPVLGVVYLPVTKEVYYSKLGEGAWKQVAEGEAKRIGEQPIHYREREQVRVVASRSHLTQEVEDFVKDLYNIGKEVEYISAGSSLKFCLVAEGKADVYPRFGPTMEWDTAAAHAVALGAGRNVIDPKTGIALSYNKESLLNPWFIVE